MKAKGMFLKKFNEPLKMEEFEISYPAEGEVLVKIVASGVCGSDVHIWKGQDPRIALPFIPGHEGIGVVQESKSKRDIFGSELKEGDLIIWDRGITCGQCYFCAIKKMPFLCPERQTYGITRNGCYATHLLLDEKTKVIKIEEKIDPAILVSASCSGATAAHAVELSKVKQGDNVVIQGPGPLGIFAAALVRERGADKIIVIGTGADKKRLELAKEFGVSFILNTEERKLEERVSFVKEITKDLGADVVIDCTGVAGAINEGVNYTARGGIYLLPGVAIPIGEVPVKFYEQVSRKNLHIQGVWVSDTSHLYRAVKLILSKKYPFEKLIDYRFKLEEAMNALELMGSRKATKAILI